MENKILIVSHTFPPASGVGGRRWAKYSKYLNRNKITPYILTSKSTFNDSLWKDDIKDINNIFFYNNIYPTIISKTQLNFFDKILYRLAILFLKICTNGNYFDRVVFEKKIVKKIDLIIKKEKITNLIISGAPFNLLHSGAIYKKNNPHINFIADFRDPWTWGQNYGITIINNRRKIIEKQKEAFVIEESDTIFVPTGIMYEYLIKTYPTCVNKIKILPHGFDVETITPRETPFELNPSKIKVAFIGELYDNISHYFELIAGSIEREDSPFFIDFYSKTERYKEIFNQKLLIGKKVNFFPLIKSDELFNTLKEYDFILILHPEYAKDYISTKFYEILYSKTPIIYISQKGITSQFIEETKSGIFIDRDSIVNFFKNDNMIKDFKYEEFKEINKFELNYLTKNILINNLSTN